MGSNVKNPNLDINKSMLWELNEFSSMKEAVNLWLDNSDSKRD